MRFLLPLLLVTILSLSVCLPAMAQECCQPGDPGYPNECCPPIDPGAPVPITGIEILIGAGALLGAKKILGNRKSNP